MDAWPFAANWDSPVKESLAWLTDVLQSPSGAEQRRALRLAPRRSFAFDVLVHAADRSMFDLWVHARGAQPVALPIWPDVQLLPVALPADGQAVECRTVGFDFAAGSMAMLLGAGPHDVELLHIDRVTPTGFDLVEPVLRDWPAGSRLFPARAARLTELPAPVRLTDQLARASLAFELLEPCSWPAAMPATLYRGRPVLESRPDESTDLTHGFERLTLRLDNEVGIPRVTDTAGRSFVLQQHAWALWGREEHAAFRGLLYGLRGRQAALWVPTHAADLVVAGTAAGTTLQVQRCGYAELGAGRMGRQDLRIELVDGTALHRRVVSAVASAELETLTLDVPLPAGLGAMDVQRISFLALCRLADDSVEISHLTDADGLARATLKFRGVRADLEAMP
jgi:hypothetical protein